MTFTVLSLFPSMVEAYFRTSIMAKAVERSLVRYRLIDIREFATDRHRTADDAPYGGGYGMVMKPEPVAGALRAAGAGTAHTIYVTPSGRPFTQETAANLASEPELVLLCGRYEGIDQRVVDRYVDDQLSVGDYVLSSGEVAALVIIDAIYRLLEGVITPGSLAEESHRDGLLEYPHYTRPEVFEGERVPEVLLSGHHQRIQEWRRRASIERTARYRPDLLRLADLRDEEREYVRKLTGGDYGPDQGR